MVCIEYCKHHNNYISFLFFYTSGLNSISYIVLTTPRPNDESSSHQSTEAYLDSLRAQLARGRQLWNDKIRNVHDFVQSLKLSSRRWGRGRSSPEASRASQEVFLCVLKLFTSASASSIGKLLRECHSNYPRDLEDQIPQLVVFLLCGSFEKAPALQVLKASYILHLYLLHQMLIV